MCLITKLTKLNWVIFSSYIQILGLPESSAQNYDILATFIACLFITWLALYFCSLKYTYWCWIQTTMKMIPISVKCEMFITVTINKVYLKNWILYKEEMLQNHLEIYRKCLVKVQFLLGYAKIWETGDFDISVPGNLWTAMILLRYCWSNIFS